MRRRRLDASSVAVLTGASSGIGRLTGQSLARQKVRLVLIGRDADALASAAGECRALGAEAIHTALDVTDPAALEAAGRAAVEAFGRIDIWVNCAAVLAFGSFEHLPEPVFRRVVETNLFGYLNGARVALAQFRRQGDEGTLINVASVLGRMGEPYVSAYVASKFAIRGWSACLRQEMRQRPGISICTVLPSPFDTPIYQKAANHTGRRARSIFPVGDPERVASAIVGLCEKPRREIVVGSFGGLLVLFDRLAPGILERLIARLGPRLQFISDAPQDPTDGNLWETGRHQSATGGWRRYWRRRLSRKS